MVESDGDLGWLAGWLGAGWRLAGCWMVDCGMDGTE